MKLKPTNIYYNTDTSSLQLSLNTNFIIEPVYKEIKQIQQIKHISRNKESSSTSLF